MKSRRITDGIILYHTVAEHFWSICLLGRAIAGLSSRRFTAIRYKFNLPMYMQEPLVIGRRGYLQRDLNKKTVTSRKRNWMTDTGSWVGERYE